VSEEEEKREKERGGIKQMAPSFGASACKSLPWERHVSIIHAAAKSFSNCRTESARVPPADDIIRLSRFADNLPD